MTNIITMPEPINKLAVRIKADIERVKRATDEWIDATLTLAEDLAIARAQFPSNQKFGAWLAEEELDWLNHDDRAALLNMADNLVLMHQVLQETDSRSYQHIWRNNKDRYLRHVTKTDPLPTPEPEIVEKPVEIPVIPVEKPEEDVEIVTEAPKPAVSDFDDIIALFSSKDTKALLRAAFSNKATAKPLAALMTRSFDEGFLVANSVSTNLASLRLVFPNCTPPHDRSGKASRYAITFDLTKPADRKRFEADVWPAVMADKAAFMADQTKLEEIVTGYLRQRSLDEQDRIKAGKIEVAMKAMPTSEREVIMFGEHMWPRIDERYGIFNYSELKTAVAVFRDLWGWFHGESPVSKAIQIRRSTRWYVEHADLLSLDQRHSLRVVWRLIHVLARLGETNPTGQIKPPSD